MLVIIEGRVTEEIIMQLSHLENKVHIYCLEYKALIPYLTIRELSENSGVSSNTVLRYIHKRGFDSFSEFKFHLKDERNHNPSVEIVSLDESIECLKKINSSVYNDLFEKAGSLLSNIRNVIFLGIGDSGLIAQYGARRFSGVGKFALAINDRYMNISQYEGDLCVIAISNTGETLEVIREVEAFKEFGAKIIAITSGSNSSLAKISDLVFSYYLTHDRYNEMSVTSQLPAMAIVERLMTVTSIENKVF